MELLAFLKLVSMHNALSSSDQKHLADCAVDARIVRKCDDDTLRSMSLFLDKLDVLDDGSVEDLKGEIWNFRHFGANDSRIPTKDQMR